MSVQFQVTDLFLETSRWHKNNTAGVDKRLDAFLQSKINNPIAPFGSKDYPMTNEGLLSGFMHAGLTSDISVFYKIRGKDPHIIELHAVMSHSEVGIGRTANKKRQKKLAQSISQAKFVG